MNETTARAPAGRDDAAEQQRVFVALWPTGAIRERLGAVADDLARRVPRARRIAPANFHLTLAFIGSLERDRAAELAVRLDRCTTTQFDWLVDRVGHFGGAHLLWAGGRENAALLALAVQIRELLDSLAIAYDRKPFAAHVTLLRGVARWPTKDWPIEPAIVWPCHRPTLVRSEQGPGGVTYVARSAL